MRSARRDRAAAPLRATRARSARIPPSPRLSARITKDMYLNVTTKVIDQNTSDTTPSTLSGVGATPCGPVKHSFRE